MSKEIKTIVIPEQCEDCGYIEKYVSYCSLFQAVLSWSKGKYKKCTECLAKTEVRIEYESI